MSLSARSQTRRLPHANVLAFLTALVVIFGSCAPVQFIAEYDEQIDRSATQLQKDVDAFLTDLETHAGTPEADYEANQGFYADYMVAHDQQCGLVTDHAQRRPA